MTIDSGWRTSGTVSKETALGLAKICEASYLEIGSFKNACGRLGVQVLRFDVVGASVFAALMVQQKLVIVFRGSDDPFDWISNADVRSIKVNGFRAHAGFATTYESLKNRVSPLVRLGGESTEVWLTGHSRGGALALLAAWQLGTEIGPSRLRLVTFGQPKVAKDELAKHLRVQMRDRYARFVNGSDFVTKIPPGYSHAGDEIHLKNGIAKIKPAIETTSAGQMTIAELENFLNVIANTGVDSRRRSAAELAEAEGAFADHAMREYIQALSSI